MLSPFALAWFEAALTQVSGSVSVTLVIVTPPAAKTPTRVLPATTSAVYAELGAPLLASALAIICPALVLSPCRQTSFQTPFGETMIPPHFSRASSPEMRWGPILACVAEGRTNREVAKLLWVTEQTVKFHLANIFRKLGVSNRTQASRWPHEHGVLREETGTEALYATPR